MDKKINKKALIVSMIFALISCGLVYIYIKSLNKPEEVKEVPKAKLLVAARDIHAGEQIQAGDIKTIEIPQDAMPEGVLNDRESIESHYAIEKIITGEPFRGERLTEWDNLALSFSIPKGKRALSVYIDENAVFSNQLRVGDKIDIIGHYIIETEDRSIEFTRIIVQDISILAIGSNRLRNNTASGSESAGSGSSGNTGDSGLPATVTLLVTPEEAETIAFTAQFADFSFILRGDKDESIVDTPGIGIDDILKGSRLEYLTAQPEEEGEQ
ncbi:MAG TPA: Flp pilus assembly protein CpaB [Clostridiaceae bacterium]|nr:Flp pilus assembly protein CpaB [Clostridiaceae bacterium]